MPNEYSPLSLCEQNFLRHAVGGRFTYLRYVCPDPDCKIDLYVKFPVRLRCLRCEANLVNLNAA